MNFNIYHVRTNEFYRVYEDLIRALAASLTDLGHACTIKLNGFVPDAVNILVGSTIFAARHLGLAKALKGRPYIVYQLEALDDRHGLLSQWPEYWDLLQNASAIWDYSPFGTEYLKGKGLRQVYHLPPAFHRTLEVLRPRQNPDIDVLFFGSSHERRHRIITALQARGIGVVNLDAAFGARRNRYISRAKIVLNLHAWDDLNQLETVRLSFLLANRAFVISEASDHDPYQGGVIYAPYERLVDVCAEYLVKPLQAHQQIAETGYRAVRKLDLVSVLRPILENMGSPKLASLAAASGGGAFADNSASRRDASTVASEVGQAGEKEKTVQIHLINLDRSPERLAEFNARNGHLRDVIRFSAVDGNDLDRAELVARGVIEPDLGYTAGALGNSLSHFRLWQQAIETNQPLTLCEDDAIFNRFFERDAAAILESLVPNWHMIFWGWNFDALTAFEFIPGVSSCVAYFDQARMRKGILQFQSATLSPRPFRLLAAFGIMCYSISPLGARVLQRLCTPLRSAPVSVPVGDRQFANKDLSVGLVEFLPQINAFASFPPLVISKNDHAISTVL